MTRTPTRIGLLSLLFLTVVTNGCGDPIDEVQLGIIQVEPNSVDFNTVLLGDFSTQFVTITNEGTGPLLVEGIRVEANTADLSLGLAYESQTLDPSAQMVIEVRYAPIELTQASGELIITSNAENADANNETRIPITTPNLQPAISCLPGIIEFGLVAEQTTNTTTVTCTNRGTAPAQISSMDLVGSFDFTSPDLAEFTYPIELGVFLADDASQQPSISFDVIYEPPTPGPDEGEVHINYDSVVSPRAILSVTGEGGVPGLSVVPNPIDFNFAPLGVTTPINATMTNTGVLPIFIHLIELGVETDDEFELGSLAPQLAVEAGSIQLAADNNLSFRVNFTPPEELIYGGSVVITHSDTGDIAEAQDTRVLLTGVGVDNLCPVAVGRAFIRDDPQQRRSNQIDWATPTDILILDGSGSSDPDGTVDRYEWELTSAPNGVTTELRPLEGFEDDDSRRQFFLPLSGRYEFTLHVYDDLGFQDCGAPATVTVLSLPDELIHIEVGWHNPLDPSEADNVGSDIDLHLTKVGYNWFDSRFDTYYANDAPDWAPEQPSLDIDDTDGAGPENIQMDNPLDCQWYAVGVHYFEKQFGTAYVTARVYIDAEQIVELPNRALHNTDDFWDVGRLHWPSGEFFIIDEVYENFDSSSAVPPAITPEMIESVSGGSCN